MTGAVSSGWPLPATGRGARPGDLTGLWSRELLRWHGEDEDDTTTQVHWLQAGKYYVDVRQPPGRPDFSQVHHWRDLDSTSLRWLLKQEGFAGPIVYHGETSAAFTWERLVDWAPEPGAEDTGTLHFEDDGLVERGVKLAYLERWRAIPISASRYAWAVGADPDSDATMVLIRLGDRFGFARGRKVALEELPDPGAVDDMGPDGLRSILDCEVSLGEIINGTWVVTRSTLPFVEHAPLAWTFTGASLAPRGNSQAGKPRWQVVDSDGDQSLLVQNLPQRGGPSVYHDPPE